MLILFQGLLVSLLIIVAKGKTVVDAKNTNYKGVWNKMHNYNTLLSTFIYIYLVNMWPFLNHLKICQEIAPGKTCEYLIEKITFRLKLHLAPPKVTLYKAHGPGLLSAKENLLGDVDDDPEVVRDRRDSTAGFVSYGFGVQVQVQECTWVEER